MTAESRARALVFGKTALVAAVYVLAIWGVSTRIAARETAPPLLPVAAAFVVVQSGVIGLLLAALVGRTLVAELQERRARRWQPPILEALAAHAAGADRSAELARWYQRHPGHVERGLAEILLTIAGIGRDRLSQLAVQLGMVARWERRCRSRSIAARRAAVVSLGRLSGGARIPGLLSALDDSDPETRLGAACNVLRHAPDASLVEGVFAFATRAPLLERAIVAEALRPHAPMLAERFIQERLESGDRDQILSTLGIIEAWGRALPALNLSSLVRDADPDIRIRALRVLPLVAGAASVADLQPEIVARLRDADPRVRGAAAFAAGRVLTVSADGALADCLRDRHPEVALAAGFALAELGRTGVEALERESVSAHRPAAAAALEALERVKIGRCDYARP